MNVAFFHGLESNPISEKNLALDKQFSFVYAPPMNYNDAGLFDKVLSEVKANKIDLLIGSSMGGYFAYCISTLTGIPTLLFNPAMVDRSIEPNVKTGNTRANHTVILGTSDDVINPIKSKEWFNKHGLGSFTFNMEGMGHRTPINIFKKYIKTMSIKESQGPIKLYEEFLIEMALPSNQWVDIDLAKLDKEDLDLIWKMYTETYAKGGMDFSADNPNELRNKYKATALKDVDGDHIADAFIIYKETKYGNKIALLGTNDKKDAKRDLIKRVVELLNKRGWFIEASLKMEEILASSNVPVITDEKMITDVVGSDKRPEMESNGYYTRFLSKASKRIRKRMYGITK